MKRTAGHVARTTTATPMKIKEMTWDRSVYRVQAWTGDTMERAPKTRHGRLNMLSDACCGQNDDANLPTKIPHNLFTLVVRNQAKWRQLTRCCRLYHLHRGPFDYLSGWRLAVVGWRLAI